MTNKIIASIFIGVGLVFVSAHGVSAQMATTTADVSIVQSAEIKPIGFFDKIKLFFTFNSEKKANLLQEFSGRSFGLATQKIEQGDIAEAESFLRESEEHLARATVAVSRIPDLAIRQQVLSRFSDISENRVSTLQDVQSRVVDEQVKQALDRAVERQESMRTSVGARLQSTKELEQKVVAVRSGTDARTNVSTTDTTRAGENIEVCDADSAPWIKVLSPNGGEEYIAGEEITVKWNSCRIPENYDIYISIFNESTTIDGAGEYVLAYNTINDGTEILVLPDNQDWPEMILGNVYKVDVHTNYVSGTQNLTALDRSDNFFKISESNLEGGGTVNSCLSVDSIAQGSMVTFPLTITGTINYGCWGIFEGEAGFAHIKQNGQALSVAGVNSGLIQMTSGYYQQSDYPASFTATIPSISGGVSGSAQLVITERGDLGEDGNVYTPEVVTIDIQI